MLSSLSPIIFGKQKTTLMGQTNQKVQDNSLASAKESIPCIRGTENGSFPHGWVWICSFPAACLAGSMSEIPQGILRCFFLFSSPSWESHDDLGWE